MTKKTATKSPEWLTSIEAAEFIGIAERTLRVWRFTQRENSPPYHKIGRSVRYLRSELEMWLRSTRVAVV